MISNKLFIIINKVLNKVLNNKVKVYLVEVYIDGFWFIRALINNKVIIELILSKIMEKIGAEFVLFEDK